MHGSLYPGDFPANPLEKAGYRLEFHDEFDEPSLDTTKWFPYYLPHWSSRERSAPHYEIRNGALVLQIAKDQQSWCPEFDGEVRASSIQTGAFAGPVGSRAGQLHFSDALVVREAQENVKTYLPQYGYFELRAKGLNTSANHVALWMIGYEDMPERSGEITVFEAVGAHSGRDASTVRFGILPWADPALQKEFYEETFPIDTTCYHLYAVEWKPAQVDYYIDNQLIKVIHQSPAYPMQFMLSIFEHPFEGAWTGVHDPAAPYPKEFTIDYFRAYQPIAGYSRS